MTGIGANLRALRKARGMTLAALAEAVGRSVGWLSQVERGLSDAAISDLRRIARALDVPLGLFFHNEAAEEGERGVVVRGHARHALGTSEDGLVEELLSPDLGGSFEMLRSTFAPGASQENAVRRETEEAGYVVSGKLDLTVEGRCYRLRAGDSFRFSHAVINWRNPGREPAVVIWVVSPPVY